MADQRAEQIVRERWHQSGRDQQYRQARHEHAEQELQSLDARWNSDVEEALEELEEGVFTTHTLAE